MKNVNKIEELENPIYNFLIYLNEKEAERLNNGEFEMLIKNLRTSFIKLLDASNFIRQIQKDEKFIESNEIIQIQLIEYCYFKISTTWDIAYQIADSMIGLTKEKKKLKLNKFELVEYKLDEFSSGLGKQRLQWYKSSNKVRNKIVHGGINIIPFYNNQRLKFQAYDNNVEELIEYSDFYYEPLDKIICADYYFNYHTLMMYSYLVDFFEFVLFAITGVRSKVLTISDDILGFFEKYQKKWSVYGLTSFNDTTLSMINDKKHNESLLFGFS